MRRVSRRAVSTATTPCPSVLGHPGLAQLDGGRIALVAKHEDPLVQGAHPDLAAAVLGQRLGLHRPVAGQRHRLQRGAGRHATEQAGLAAEPEPPAAIAQHGPDLRSGSLRPAPRGAGALDAAGGRVQVVQAAVGHDPQPTGTVIDDLAHADVAQAVRAADGDRHETVRRGVVAQQPGGTRAHPEPTGGVTVQGLHIVVGQGAGALGVRLVDPEPVAVPARQTPEGADPQEALPVLGHRRRDGIGQPLLLAQVLEGDVRELGPAPFGR
jgi:hypothetical protein